MLPVPVCAFDIAPDGTPTPCEIDAPPGDGWRWLHFDLSDPAMPEWLIGQVPPVVSTALQSPETRPRFDRMGEGDRQGLLINLRGVNLNEGADPEDMVALRIWATHNRVVTMRRRRIMAVDALRQAAESGQAPATPSAFLAAIAEGLTVRIETVALALEDEVDDLEEELVAGHEVRTRDMLELRQTLIKLKRFIGPQREALMQLGRATGGLPDAATAPHILETADRAARSVDILESARDRMAALQDHLEAKSAAELGRNGYVLSVVAAIFLPLGFLTGLFGVNVAGMPGTDWPWAFAALTVSSAVLGIGLFLLFRWLKWL